ncbi:MAG: hypothetical protein Q4B88_01980 [Moraxella sp.]|nr:hypothetical protein [Moraxella sp.]
MKQLLAVCLIAVASQAFAFPFGAVGSKPSGKWTDWNFTHSTIEGGMVFCHYSREWVSSTDPRKVETIKQMSHIPAWQLGGLRCEKTLKRY